MGYSIFIPHAGKLYAGEARKKAFDCVRTGDIKYIIYIASIHNILRGSQEKIYLLQPDDFYIEGCKFDEYPSDEHEHSYEWVKDELLERFPNTKKLVIGPTSFSKNTLEICFKISSFILKHSEEVLLIGTSDLLHYGKSSFPHSKKLSYPQRQSKIFVEENIIQSIVNSDYLLDDDILCGPYATKMFCQINKILGRQGIIVDYYDSSVYDKKGIDKYCIFPLTTQEFVSYASICYSDEKILGDFDEKIAIAFVKSILLRNLSGENYKLKLGKWHSFTKMKNGVFVGTYLNSKVNSCYGSYESDKFLSDNLISAANMCIQDSVLRWKNPITNKNINKLEIKIDILDEKKSWVKLSSDDYIRKFKLDGTFGVYLVLPNGSSATYLPSVSEEYKDKWNSSEYIENLCQKAGGYGTEWKSSYSKIFIYKVRTISGL